MHSCGLRTDGTITCWGANTDELGVNYFAPTGGATAPAGQFSAVTAGLGHSCGLRIDGTITCWGLNTDALGDNYYGQADAPAGQFSAVTAGIFYSCGLRTDGTITCWGLNVYGQATAPAGQFSAVAAGVRCAPTPCVRAAWAPTAPPAVPLGQFGFNG